MGRDGLLRMLDQVRERSFDVVIVEALDRLSRDLEDLAGIHKRLSFLGVEIRAVHEGVVNCTRWDSQKYKNLRELDLIPPESADRCNPRPRRRANYEAVHGLYSGGIGAPTP
jgi:Resolvase, N terminal domain